MDVLFPLEHGLEAYSRGPPGGGQAMPGAAPLASLASASTRPAGRPAEHFVKNDLKSVSIMLPETCLAGEQLQVLKCQTSCVCLSQTCRPAPAK